MTDKITRFLGVENIEPNVTTSVVIAVGAEDDVRVLTELYCLDPGRVVREEDYEEALREKFLRHRRGDRVGLVTVGHTSRDLVRLTQPPSERTSEHSSMRDLVDRMRASWERSIPVKPEPDAPVRPTWEELVRREPRLHDLLVLTETVDRDAWPHYHSTEVIFGPHGQQKLLGLKHQMKRLVGHHAITDDAVIRSSAAYDLVYHTLYEALPYDFTRSELAERRPASSERDIVFADDIIEDDIPF